MTRLPRPLVVVAVALLALALSGACCGDEETCNGDNPGGELPPVPTGEVFATPGCDVDDITTEGNEVCAVCEERDICGIPEVARCERIFDSNGESCRFCPLPTGEVLFDSCFSGGQPGAAPELRCEGNEIVEENQDTVCRTCVDDAGNFIQQTCEPITDECNEVVVQGQQCRQCTRDNVVVILECEAPDLEPRSCQLYQNDIGRCVDCFGDDDQLISHQCAFIDEGFITCNDTVSPDGVFCHECTDKNGAIVEFFCDDQPPPLESCGLLNYSEQTCVVCIDGFGGLGHVDCERTNCDGTDPAAPCEPPPECIFVSGANGELCRRCPTDAGVDEEACLLESNVRCFDDFESGCFVCADNFSGTEVYRSCDSAIPLICGAAENAAGEACELCTNPETGEPAYSFCGDQFCYATSDFNLRNATQDLLFLENGQPAIASCVACQDSVEPYTGTCRLREAECGATSFTDPNAGCDATVSFKLVPIDCFDGASNPWEQAGFFGFYQTPDEALQILSFALDVGGLAAVAIETESTQAALSFECTEQCCPRGDILELAVRVQDAQLASELFGAVIARCASDADCAAGDTCRADGSCG